MSPADLDPDTVAELARRAKIELRKRARAVRRALPADAVSERSARIVARLLDDPRVAAARGVGLFWPMSAQHEVDLRELDAALRARGVRLAYPSIEATARPRMTLRWVDDPGDLALRSGKFAEPPPTAEQAASLDVVIVPALLVDGRGARLGYGGGYYDEALPAHCPPACAIAVVFDFQIVSDVPETGDDVRVDAVVSCTRSFTTPLGDEDGSPDARRARRSARSRT